MVKTIIQIYKQMLRVFTNQLCLVFFGGCFFCKSYNIYTIFWTTLICEIEWQTATIKKDSYSEHTFPLNSIKWSILEYFQSDRLTDGRTCEKDRRTTGTFYRSLLRMGNNSWPIKFRIQMCHHLFVTITQ
jgi:hypothetical protein